MNTYVTTNCTLIYCVFEAAGCSLLPDDVEIAVLRGNDDLADAIAIHIGHNRRPPSSPQIDTPREAFLAGHRKLCAALAVQGQHPSGVGGEDELSEAIAVDVAGDDIPDGRACEKRCNRETCVHARAGEPLRIPLALCTDVARCSLAATLRLLRVLPEPNARDCTHCETACTMAAAGGVLRIRDIADRLRHEGKRQGREVPDASGEL